MKNRFRERFQDLHRQQERKQNCKGGRTPRVLERCLCSAFGVTGLLGERLCVAFKAISSILAVPRVIIIASCGAKWHAGIGFMEQLSLYFILAASQNIQILFYFPLKHTEVCQSFTGQQIFVFFKACLALTSTAVSSEPSVGS